MKKVNSLCASLVFLLASCGGDETGFMEVPPDDVGEPVIAEPVEIDFPDYIYFPDINIDLACECPDPPGKRTHWKVKAWKFWKALKECRNNKHGEDEDYD